MQAVRKRIANPSLGMTVIYEFAKRLFALAAIGFLVAGFMGCNGAGAGMKSEKLPEPPPVQRVARPSFDGKRAFAHLKAQCDFGPRPVGTEAHRKTKDYLVAELQKCTEKVSVQEFRYRGMPLWNVIAEFNPEAKRKILLCSHWDTRPRADQELDPVRARQPILGANDGASGVAVLLEMARLFKQQTPSVGVVIVMLDGEDYGDFSKDEGVFLGSKHFAKNQRGLKLEFGILLDMVGDRNLVIDREQNSEQIAPEVNEKVFRIARELGYSANFVNDLKTNVLDDHIPLSQGGIPTIDLIDFNYRYWHTLEDTPDKCSAESLGIVGDVVTETIYREKER